MEPVAIAGMIVGLLAVLAALLTGRALSRSERSLRIGAVVAVAFIAAWFYFEECCGISLRLIRWDDFVYVQRVPLYFAILSLLAMCLPRLRVAMRRLTTVVAVLFTLYVIAESAVPATLGLYLGALDGRTDGPPEVTQSTGWSCGAAALAWALRLKGVETSEREMAQLAVVAPLRGMSVRGSVRALHRKGFEAPVQYGVTWDELLDAPKPALAGWRLSSGIGHAIVIIDATEDEVTVGDPLIGETTYRRDEFVKRWDRALTLIY